jgi:GAF domain-containing protein
MAARVAAVRDLGGIDGAPEERFDRITRLAGKLFDVPLVLFGFVDANREVMKSQFGTLPNGSPSDLGALVPVVQAGDAVFIEDLRQDARFSGHPEVASGSRLRFYAGYPVHSPGGQVIGTLCILDQRPRQLSENDKLALRDLARLAEDELKVPK